MAPPLKHTVTSRMMPSIIRNPRNRAIYSKISEFFPMLVIYPTYISRTREHVITYQRYKKTLLIRC